MDGLISDKFNDFLVILRRQNDNKYISTRRSFKYVHNDKKSTNEQINHASYKICVGFLDPSKPCFKNERRHTQSRHTNLAIGALTFENLCCH